VFCQSPSVISAHPPSAYGAPRATDLCILLVADSALNFTGAACSLVLIGFSVMIAPWEYVVYVKTGKWVLLSSGGVPTFYDGWDVYRIRLIQATEYIQQVPDDLKALANRAWDGSQQESPMQFIHNELVNEPVVLLKALALKVVRPWYGTDSRNHEKPILLFQMLYGILAIIGMVLTLRRQMPFRFQACVLLSVILRL
jgi:hypothetical protein